MNTIYIFFTMVYNYYNLGITVLKKKALLIQNSQNNDVIIHLEDFEEDRFIGMCS